MCKRCAQRHHFELTQNAPKLGITIITTQIEHQSSLPILLWESLGLAALYEEQEIKPTEESCRFPYCAQIENSSSRQNSLCLFTLVLNPRDSLTCGVIVESCSSWSIKRRIIWMLAPSLTTIRRSTPDLQNDRKWAADAKNVSNTTMTPKPMRARGRNGGNNRLWMLEKAPQRMDVHSKGRGLSCSSRSGSRCSWSMMQLKIKYSEYSLPNVTVCRLTLF